MSEQKKVPATEALRVVETHDAHVIHLTGGPTMKPVVIKFNPLTAKVGDVLVQVVMQED